MRAGKARPRQLSERQIFPLDRCTQMLLVQSVFSLQCLPLLQGEHVPPPQSTSVSAPSFMPSEQPFPVSPAAPLPALPVTPPLDDSPPLEGAPPPFAAPPRERLPVVPPSLPALVPPSPGVPPPEGEPPVAAGADPPAEDSVPPFAGGLSVGDAPPAPGVIIPAAPFPAVLAAPPALVGSVPGGGDAVGSPALQATASSTALTKR